ncbi:reverse transcriptase domain-containing protein [Stenotrophomonas sepilia]
MKRWEHRFQVKSGRWVFVPTPASRAVGEQIRARVAKAWSPPAFYYHLRKGGHVAALRAHAESTYFFRCDLKNFFGSINLSRVTRCLKRYFSYVEARGMASASVVIAPGATKTMLPYGFVQSPLLASLALDQSRVGAYLRKLSAQEGITVSVYMDDIVVSSLEIGLLDKIKAELGEKAEKAGISLNQEKTEGPSTLVTVFNVELSHNSLVISEERMAEFREALMIASCDAVAMGILGYIASVNDAQLSKLYP